MFSIQEDFSLFEDFQAGFQPAIRCYFDYYGKSIHYLLERKMGKAAVSGTEEVFKTLFEHRNKIGNPAQLWDFLYSTAQQVVSRYQQQHEGQDMDLFKPLGGRKANSEKYEKIRVAVMRVPELQRAIKELPPRKQQIFGYKFQGMSTREIADLLGIKPQTVLNHLSQAINRLNREHGDKWGKNNPFLA